MSNRFLQPAHQLDAEDAEWFRWTTVDGGHCFTLRSAGLGLWLDRVGPKRWRWMVASPMGDTETDEQTWRRLAAELDEMKPV